MQCRRGKGQHPQRWPRPPQRGLTLAAPIIDRSWDDGLPGIIHSCGHEAGSLQRVWVGEKSHSSFNNSAFDAQHSISGFGSSSPVPFTPQGTLGSQGFLTACLTPRYPQDFARTPPALRTLVWGASTHCSSSHTDMHTLSTGYTAIAHCQMPKRGLGGKGVPSLLTTGHSSQG